MQGELLFDVNLKLSPGVIIGAVPEGMRVNVPFAGNVTGPKISGKYEGVDYLLARPDGVALVHVHGVITTDGGDLISVEVSGFISEAPDKRQTLKGTSTFRTASNELAWLNSNQGVEEGYVDIKLNELTIQVYKL